MPPLPRALRRLAWPRLAEPCLATPSHDTPRLALPAASTDFPAVPRRRRPQLPCGLGKT